MNEIQLQHNHGRFKGGKLELKANKNAINYVSESFKQDFKTYLFCIVKFCFKTA